MKNQNFSLDSIFDKKDLNKIVFYSITLYILGLLLKGILPIILVFGIFSYFYKKLNNQVRQ